VFHEHDIKQVYHISFLLSSEKPQGFLKMCFAYSKSKSLNT